MKQTDKTDRLIISPYPQNLLPHVLNFLLLANNTINTSLLPLPSFSLQEETESNVLSKPFQFKISGFLNSFGETGEKGGKNRASREIMADIAILVAEEYERRLNMERKGLAAAAAAAASEKNVDRQFHLVEINANWGSHSASTSAAEGFMSRVAEIARKKGMVIIEPKSQIGVAASTGFFSA